jgi:regulator of sigma D
VMWITVGGCTCTGHGKEVLNILNRYVKRVYIQMISHLVVFCQLVAMQVSWMKACAVMLNDHSLHNFCKIGKLHLHG